MSGSPQRRASYRFFEGTVRDRPLATLLPLAAPLSVHVDPSSACNLRCQFCPTGHPKLLRQFGKPTAVMELALFSKIVRDLKAFPERLLRLHLYKDGEPLLNPDLPTMVARAKDADVASSVETTTNGLLLTAAVARQLATAGLDRIRISMQHIDSAGYLSLTKRRVDVKALVDQLREAIGVLRSGSAKTKVHVKILDTGLSPAEKADFLETFSPVADEIHVDALMGWTNGDLFDFTLGKSPTTGMSAATPLKRSRTVCSQPFYTMAVNVDGEVSVCCVDWTQTATVGHAAHESLYDVWHGERLRAFRLLHLDGRRAEHPACSSCSYVLGLPDRADLDAAAGALRRVYRLDQAPVSECG